MLERSNYQTLLQIADGGNEVLPVESPTAIQQVNPAIVTTATIPNIVSVDSAPPVSSGFSDTQMMIAAGLGIGALLLFPGKGKKSMGTIGKKGKKGSEGTLLLLGGIAAAWYFMNQDNNPAPAAVVPVVTTVPPLTIAPNPAYPVNVPIQTLQAAHQTSLLHAVHFL